MKTHVTAEELFERLRNRNGFSVRGGGVGRDFAVVPADPAQPVMLVTQAEYARLEELMDAYKAARRQQEAA